MIDGSEMHEEAMATSLPGAPPGHVWGTWPPQSKVDANQFVKARNTQAWPETGATDAS